jgi:nitrate/nitrite-specific signal transduction histidine kinase
VKPAPTSEVRSGLGAFGRTARALVSAVTLRELARGALEEMRDARGLEVAALYLPADDGRPALERLEVAGSGRQACERLVFDEESWQLAVQGDAPLVMHDRGAWLMEHPFSPPADVWLVLPLGTGVQRLGVVIAAGEVASDAGVVLRLLGDLLGAGIATARLRQEIEHTALERERLRLAAEVHDGLAQDLALAMRELALLDNDDEASRERLRAAVTSAHGIVRSRLKGMLATPGLGGLRPALEDLCARFSHRGVRVELCGDERLPEVSPEVAVVALRVLSEALTNVERHAGAAHAVIEARAADGRLRLVVSDDGPGFAAAEGPPEGHFGLLLMRERAQAAGAELTVESAPGCGTRVALSLPA